MLTALEARQLAGPTLEEKIEALLEAIRVAATAKKRSIKTGWQHKQDDDLWIDGGYNNSPDWKTAKKVLEDLGYKVTFIYNANQFVDMYTLVEW